MIGLLDVAGVSRFDVEGELNAANNAYDALRDKGAVSNSASAPHMAEALTMLRDAGDALFNVDISDDHAIKMARFKIGRALTHLQQARAALVQAKPTIPILGPQVPVYSTGPPRIQGKPEVKPDAHAGRLAPSRLAASPLFKWGAIGIGVFGLFMLMDRMVRR